LTLVVPSFFPLLAASVAIIGKRTGGSMNEAQGAYGSAGGVASEDPSLRRAVRALNGRMWKLRITMSS
jgi:hypothetical protein